MKSYKEKIIVDDDAITLMNLSDIHRNATINKIEIKKTQYKISK